MMSYFKSILKNPFLTASLVMVIGSNVYNAGQLGFHIVAARILGTAHYGDVAALMNILGVFAIVQISLGLTVVKFVASGTDDKEVKNLVRWSLKVSLIMGVVMALIILAFSPFINRFLQLSQPVSIYILAPVILLYAVITITRSVLQGLLRFYIYVTSLIVEVGVKFVLMIIFVLSGFAVIGAMSALLTGVTCALLISIFALNKSFLRGVTKTPEIKPLLVYVLPAFLQGLALTSMYSTDLFLVKHFFPPETAGVYAAVAKLGSIVYFAASPIANVMFPLVAKRHAHGENYHKIFYLSLLMVIVVSLGIIALYTFSASLKVLSTSPSTTQIISCE